jgi:PilZ domain
MLRSMPDATLTSERRREQRKRPLGLVYVELSSNNGGMLRDLSEKGFAMRSMIPLRPGDSSSFVFSLDPETRLQGQCKVQWVEEDGRVAGLEFTNVSAELPRVISAWLLDNSFPVPSAITPAKPPAREASSLQELREELRSVTPNSNSSKLEETKLDPEPVVRVAPHPIWVQTRNNEPPLIEPEGSVAAAFIAPASMPPAAPTTPPETKFEISSEPIEPPAQQQPTLEPLALLPEMEPFHEPVLLNRDLARSSISLALRMMIVLALLAGAVVFHRPLGNGMIWLGQKIAGSDAPEISYVPVSEQSLPQPTPSVASANPVSPSPDATNAPVTGSPVAANNSADNSAPSPPTKNIEVPPVSTNSSPQPQKNSSVRTAAPTPLPATNRTTTFSSPPNPGPEQPGQQEYLAAEDILRNKNSTAGLSEAVRLLWVAVEKGNSNAEVALAELYRTGHGVTKSCDQTGILLNAAAKKGNSDAQRHLDEFRKEGCE